MENSPLNPQQTQALSALQQGLQPLQAAWLSGYFAHAAAGSTATSAPAIQAGEGLCILYGSQTGNGKNIATKAAQAAAEKGIPATVKNMGDLKPKKLRKEKHLMVIVSTHGEGEAPDEAMDLHQFILSDKAPSLKDAHFAVLGLGDTSYEFFCQMGVDFDKRLQELGATRATERVDCDLDYTDQAEEWIQTALEALGKNISAEAPPAPTFALPTQSGKTYSQKEPFQAELTECQSLNGRGSAKENYHIVLSLENSDMHYQAGDALGIIPQNDPQYVDDLIKQATFDPAIRDTLLNDLEITTITRPVIKAYAEKCASKELNTIIADPAALKKYLYGREWIDVLKQYPIKKFSGQDFAQMLRKIPPRLYSIASSLDANEDEVHLTVGATHYQSHGRQRKGVASTYLADRIPLGEKIKIYVQTNDHFRLPTNPDTPIIMIGPGTGIAPFRAFIEQRDNDAATGKNWLFFGDQHFTTDFLYQTEWLNYHKNGLLTHLDVAFSRDQKEKIYVQDRMLEKAETLYTWLQEGAYIYVCGDESKMAPDVHEALIKIVETQSDKTREQAEAYIKELQKSHRYLRDIY